MNCVLRRSTLVVQECHLWLCLADIKEHEKVQFLNAPVSQTGLFGDALKSFAQQFSAAQKQTEAIKHIMHQRKPAASTPACRHGRPPVAALTPMQPQQPSSRQRQGAGRTPSPSRPRQTWQQVQVALRWATQRWRRLLIRRW